jgi:hypothetical protein
MRTARFWWIAVAYFAALFAWYAVQVHQTKYLIETGFSAQDAAWALGAVSLAGVPGRSRSAGCRTASGARSCGRSATWGFASRMPRCLRCRRTRAAPLLYVMVVAQGAIGYGLTSVVGAIPAEIFEGKHYGRSSAR